MSTNMCLLTECSPWFLDCTGKKTEDPYNIAPAIHTYFPWIRWVQLANIVVAIVTAPNPGSATDNSIVKNDWFGYRLSCVCCSAVFVFDKGLTDKHKLETDGVHVICPRKKARGQIAFDDERKHGDKQIVVYRIHIERNNEELQNHCTWDGGRLTLSKVDLHVQESECIRGVVNLKPPIHDWFLPLNYRISQPKKRNIPQGAETVSLKKKRATLSKI
ncbi:hypothetical protein SARC_12788 [Sphaeroforma arctica JP610]|uniref:Uncharacterized protein n=1 Tax=Sphaeroforma arctica JP610 TaxID=667725 RepID=A0A0L0FDY8_9EUKA|nr:hypothetical protein SARC_12788 [Sphaeroforma arctica JP610]KNC74671.1 hypothetical protein SARC_12788 [Sphaeroforma arctica JP610]|eukprot:XP_014148573.1 hypothetical protein SARC_12788 [Sphaeroforma arctica JP610]